MSDGQDHQRRYSPGERIILGLELYNDNGIFYVAGRFVHADYPTVHITLPGYGGGKQHTTVYIQNVIVTNTLPSQYICEYIQAEDGRGNFSGLHPNITFYVEQQSALVDDQGPQLKGGWSFLPRGAIEFVEIPMIEWEKGEKHLDTERQLEPTASGTTEDTNAQGDIQESTPGTPATPEDTQGDAQENIHQLIQGKITEGISGMTEDTGAGGDVGLHIERRMDEIAHDVTEETDTEADIHLHDERRMEEMAKKMFEED